VEIDLLVTVALYGPAEAIDWDWIVPFLGHRQPVSLPAAGTELGTMLWQRNAANVLDPEWDDPLPEYLFEQLRCPVSVVEALKMVRYYEHQTDDGETYVGSPAWRFCTELTGSLIHRLPGYQAAPWGWEPVDVDIRADRARAASAAEANHDPAAEPDDDIRRVLTILASGGAHLTPFTGHDADLAPRTWSPFHDAPWNMLAHWADHPPHGHSWLDVRIFAETRGAHAAYLARRSAHEHNLVREFGRDGTRRIARYGRVVVDLVHTDGIPADHPLATRHRQLHDAFDALAEPDEAWSNKTVAPVAEFATGRTLARGVRSLFNSDVKAAFVANDPAELARLLRQVDDPDVRDQLSTVDLFDQTVVMIIGIGDMEPVGTGRLVELAVPDAGQARFRLELNVEGTWKRPAVVVALPKIATRPAEVVLIDPEQHDRLLFGTLS
jgi:hypothetical protein